MTDQSLPIADLRQRLNDLCRDLFRQAWGDPVHPGATEWRAKADSARSMIVSGPDAGAWFDFKSGRGGYGLEFVATQVLGLTDPKVDFRVVLTEATRIVGVAGALSSAANQPKLQRPHEADHDAERASKILLARALYDASLSLVGSPGQAYLASRGITKWPHDLRFLPPLTTLPVLLWTHREFLHPQYPSVVAFCRNAAGEITGGQRILLEANGNKAPVEERKPSFGALRGAAFRLPGTASDGPVLLAEGPETALSLWQSTEHETWSVLGVSGFKSAPVPFDRRVIVCPDRDPPESAAGKALDEALRELHARGVDLWVADAPEPEASKGDFNDTLRRAGAEAVRAAVKAARPFTPRAKNGRYGGWSVFECEPQTGLDFVSVEDAASVIRDAAESWRKAAGAWDGSGDPPVTVIAASPGAGKSVITRQVLAEVGCDGLDGDIVYYAPTLELADEAAEDYRKLTGSGHVMRGRSAINPATGDTMCHRADLAERVVAAGLRVRPTLCEVEKVDGSLELCPHHATCAYLAQTGELGPDPAVRFASSAYLTLPGDGTSRKIAARVIDEKCWSLFVKIVDIPLSAWVRQRRQNVKLAGDAVEAAMTAAEMTEAARVIAAELKACRSPVNIDLPSETLEEYARYELKASTLTAGPSASDDVLLREVDAYAAFDPGASDRAEVWRILAECKRRGLLGTERLRLVNVEGEEVLRVTRRGPPPSPKPTLLLDADADPEITDRLFPGAQIHRVALRPNAEVIQVSDRLFSMSKLQSEDLRADVAAFVRTEAFRDKLNGGLGVLCVASRKVVLQFYRDAGHPVAGMSIDEANRYIRATPLHGAHWIWFGPGSLGKNVWQNFGTAIVVGREELPVDALQDMGRAFFGDSGTPLRLLDEVAGRPMPLEEVDYSLSDGTGRATRVPVHPDRRLAALQRQRRELASRQAFERLRLARSTDPKRLVLLSKLPIPGLPVDELVTWGDLLPSRLNQAIAEAGATRPFLRLSAAGLAEDAPRTFRTVEAARLWLRTAGREALKWGGTVYSTKYGTTPFTRCALKPSGRPGKATPVLLLDASGAEALVQHYGPRTIVRPVEQFDLPRDIGATDQVGLLGESDIVE